MDGPSQSFKLQHSRNAVPIFIPVQNISCMTSSEIASVEAAVHGIPLRDLQDPKVEVYHLHNPL